MLLFSFLSFPPKRDFMASEETWRDPGGGVALLRAATFEAAPADVDAVAAAADAADAEKAAAVPKIEPRGETRGGAPAEGVDDFAASAFSREVFKEEDLLKEEASSLLPSPTKLVLAPPPPPPLFGRISSDVFFREDFRLPAPGGSVSSGRDSEGGAGGAGFRLMRTLGRCWTG